MASIYIEPFLDYSRCQMTGINTHTMETTYAAPHVMFEFEEGYGVQFACVPFAGYEFDHWSITDATGTHTETTEEYTMLYSSLSTTETNSITCVCVADQDEWGKIRTDSLTNLANAVRARTGETSQMSINELITEIGEIPIPSGNINITDTYSHDVSWKATAQVVDSNLAAGNIKKDVSILGITGTLESEPDLTDITITTNGTYTHSGYDGYDEVVVNVPQSGAPTSAELTFSNDLGYWDYNGKWDWFITKYGSQITVNNLGSTSNMFKGCTLTSIPFVLHTTDGGTNLANLMDDYSAILTPPVFSGGMRCLYMPFNGSRITSCPSSVFENVDFSTLQSSAMACYGLFYLCRWLRSYDATTTNEIYSSNSGWNGGYYERFYCCFTLDEINNLVVIPVEYTSSRFEEAFTKCCHLKKLTFESGKTQTWSNQTINLTSYVGYANTELTSWGIPAGKEVTDATTYAALKNDPDWWTYDVNYSRYNHDSAVETINSLPDCSAGSSNTIKFKGASGTSTDGGAISTLTSAEIAVATAKGWTVSLS